MIRSSEHPARAAGLLVLALALLPANAGAVELTLWNKPLDLNITEYGAVAYHIDNGNLAPSGSPNYDPTGSGYVDWLNRFQIDGSWGDFTLLLRLDSELYFRPPVAPPGDAFISHLLLNRFENRADLEKVAAGYTSRHLEVVLGDSYVTYGRGLVLALRKEDELGVDTTLRGASVTGRVAGLNLNAVAGVSNILNVDTATAREADDPDDLIVGSRAEYRFGKWVVPGVDVAYVRYANNFSTGPQQERDHLATYSATLEFPYLWGHGNIYMEYARQDDNLGDSTQSSSAFYAAGTGYWGPVTLLVEFKNYQSFQPIYTSLNQSLYPELALTNFYNAPPTLERLNQELLDNTYVHGPHARVDVAITPNIGAFISMAYFVDRVTTTNSYDPYAGVEAHWQDAHSRFTFSGGRRISRFDDQTRFDGLLFQDVTHLEYDVNQWLGGINSIELDGQHQGHHDSLFGLITTWSEGQAYLSFKRAGAFSVAAGYEYYTQLSETVRSNYFNGSASVQITPQILIRLFAGGQRAGIKCVNGVCRNYPAFEGVRSELIAKF